MKKIAVIIILVFVVVFSGSSVLAANGPSTSLKPDLVVTLGTNQTHSGDYFAYGDNVLISGTVNGDVYAAGKQIYIDGNVTGDVLAAGGTVTVKGKVTQDVRVMGGQVMIGGEVGKNLTLVGGNLVVTSDAKLGGNLVAAGGNLVINSPVPGNLNAAVGNLMLTANVSGNINASVGQLTLTPKVAVKGDLTYKSEQKALMAGEATVSGKVTHITYNPDKTTKPSTPLLTLASLRQKLSESFARIFTLLFWVSLLGSLITGYLLVHFFPNFTYDAITTIEDHPWKTMGVGFLTVAILPIIIFLLLVTVVGVPLGLVVGLYYGLALYFSRIIFSYWLGARFIHRLARMAGRGVTLSVGLLLFYLLSAVTYFGPVLMGVALFWGMGALILAERKAYLTARKAKIV